MWLFNFCRPPPTPPSPHLAVWRFFTSLFTFQLSCFQTYFYLATWSHNWHVNMSLDFVQRYGYCFLTSSSTYLRRFNFRRVSGWLILNFFYFCFQEITTSQSCLIHPRSISSWSWESKADYWRNTRRFGCIVSVSPLHIRKLLKGWGWGRKILKLISSLVLIIHSTAISQSEL